MKSKKTATLAVAALLGSMTACEAPLSIPHEQAQVIQALDRYRSEYRAAGSGMELQRKALRKERAAALERAIPSRRADGWVGTVSATFSAQSNTKAGVMIKLKGSENAYAGTWNNFLSDAGSNTLFAEGTDLYRTTVALKKGQLVRISGRFFESTQDFLKEQSLTENGSMTMPELLFFFESIEPL
jgi:hypothetical protein